MEEHRVAAQHFVSQFGDDLTVHRDHARLDVLVSIATRANAGVGEELIETNGLVGIVSLLFVVYTLLARVEALGVGLAETAVLRSAAVATSLWSTVVAIAISTVAVGSAGVAVDEARARRVSSATRFVPTLVATVFVAFLLTITAGGTTEAFARTAIATTRAIIVSAVLAIAALAFIAAGAVVAPLTGRVIVIIVAALAIIATVTSVIVISAIAV